MAEEIKIKKIQTMWETQLAKKLQEKEAKKKENILC